jgi:hypothetical protein
MRWLTLIIALVLFPFGAVRTESPVTGAVLSHDGTPIEGGTVFASVPDKCCPVQREFIKTDAAGHFRLEHPGAVIHFKKNTFQEQTLVVTPEMSDLRIMLEPATPALPIPDCGVVGRDQTLIGWDPFGLHFKVPTRGTKLSGGKPDVDYLVYTIKPKSGRGYLELWFGPYALPTDPDDDEFINSVNFAQRDVAAANGKAFGTDSWGQFRSGGSWRWTAVFTQGGSTYHAVGVEDARLFDQIVNLMCEIPITKR